MFSDLLLCVLNNTPGDERNYTRIKGIAHKHNDHTSVPT